MTAVVAPWLALPSDEHLLKRYSAGDRSALGELFQRHREAAYRVAFRLLGNEADALDALQDAFLKVFAHLADFEGRSSFKTWLLRVVSNSALDFGRQRGRREVLSFEALCGMESEKFHPPIEYDMSAGLQQAELRERVEQALRELSDAQRQTFVLHVDGGLSYREVAQVLKVSVGTVMSRLYYARQKLRSALSKVLGEQVPCPLS